MTPRLDNNGALAWIIETLSAYILLTTVVVLGIAAVVIWVGWEMVHG